MALIETTDERRELMHRIRSVAVVGVSANHGRPSHTVARYLLDHTEWTVWFVNPTVDTTLGRQVYPSLAELPGVPDLVDVFRGAEHLPAVVDEAIAVGASAVWFQLGLANDAAAERAVAAGLDVVQDRCLQIEHSRLLRR